MASRSVDRVWPCLTDGCRYQEVTIWAVCGLCNSNRLGTNRTIAQDGDWNWIRDRNLRGVSIENAAVDDIRAVEKFWLIDLVTRRAI
ncbi:hypothetical protein [Sphingopyxis sp.]|uniref:hypothetical protein n=1 Tax=Sphingopyxis sp. TaxID=1908224 RepID=UPI002D77CB8A|nr:hypothetical protein [Sphingopyxis sp.]HET6525039.1 hypothetical protein [Sphingopyxis sp.]